VEAARRVSARRALWGGVALGGVVGLIATQLRILGGREFLPMDPGYRIDEVVPAPDGEMRDPVRIGVLGDSTVAGVGAPTASGSLPVLVAVRVAAALGRPVAVTGLGVSGARTATVLADQVPRLGGWYDAVVVMVGANDATHATPWWRLRRDLEAVLRAARDRAPVVVVGGTPRFHRNQIIPEPIRTALDRYSTLLRGHQRAAVRAVAGVAFVDIAAEASPRFFGVPEATSVDGFHPSPIGYGFWADALAERAVAGLSDASH
jgi:lysophospholipase L1-like esterase